MKAFINRFATPLTTGLFLVSTVSGVALFFRWGPAMFHAMHEWLSMVLLLPFLLHAWKNWSSLIGYLQRGTLLIPLLLCIAVAVPFAIQNGRGRDDNPSVRMTRMLTQARLSDLAPVLKTTPEALVDRLRAQGYASATPEATIEKLAAERNARPAQTLFGLMAPK